MIWTHSGRRVFRHSKNVWSIDQDQYVLIKGKIRHKVECDWKGDLSRIGMGHMNMIKYYTVVK